MPELGALQVLAEIARSGSLGAAGRELGFLRENVEQRLEVVVLGGGHTGQQAQSEGEGQRAEPQAG